MIFSDWPWRHWRQVRGEAIALRLNDEQLNWRELCARVDELASSFAVQGVVEGSGVMLRAWNTPQTLLAWLALLQCGARVLPVNPQLPQPLLEELLPNLFAVQGVVEGSGVMLLACNTPQTLLAWLALLQ